MQLCSGVVSQGRVTFHRYLLLSRVILRDVQIFPYRVFSSRARRGHNFVYILSLLTGIGNLFCLNLVLSSLVKILYSLLFLIYLLSNFSSFFMILHLQST